MPKNKLKKLLETKTEDSEVNNKKKIENLVFFVIILIITIVAINVIWSDKPKNVNNETNDANKRLANIDYKTSSIAGDSSNLEIQEESRYRFITKVRKYFRANTRSGRCKGFYKLF